MEVRAFLGRRDLPAGRAGNGELVLPRYTEPAPEHRLSVSTRPSHPHSRDSTQFQGLRPGSGAATSSEVPDTPSGPMLHSRYDDRSAPTGAHWNGRPHPVDVLRHAADRVPRPPFSWAKPPEATASTRPSARPRQLPWPADHPPLAVASLHPPPDSSATNGLMSPKSTAQSALTSAFRWSHSGNTAR